MVKVISLILIIPMMLSLKPDQPSNHPSDNVSHQKPETSLNEENPFFAPSELPFQAPDFDAIRIEHYMPAFEAGMKVHLEEIEAIATQEEVPTFENTIVAMELSGSLLTRVQRVFFNLTSSHTNAEIQEIQSEISPRLAAHSDNISLNADLFQRIETLYNQREELDLDPSARKLLEDTRRSFVRSGALLSEDEKQRMREINERMSTLTTEFSQNLLKLTKERSVFVEDAAMLDGLSEGRMAAAQEAAEEQGYDNGYLITITNTTRQPILKSLNNREMRKRIWEASAERGVGQQGGVDNRPLIKEMVALRAERANLLGYDNYASYSLEPQTAKTPENALDMLTGLIPAVVSNTRLEAREIEEMMRAEGLEDGVMPWDWGYYSEKVRKAKYEIDQAEVRPYFELNRVLEDGVFYTMNRLYGVTFTERFDLPLYHEDVRTFDVLDEDGEQIGLFYADYVARSSKRGGAWMSSFVSQNGLTGDKPVIVNVLNVEPPAEGEPTLVTFDNVTTLFHEVGHGVHGLFSEVTYPSQAGTSVPRDFVEFPSTFEEDWAIHPEVLGNYAYHYETGEAIPDELLAKLIDARNFNQGFDTYEYLAATMLDLEWHMLSMEEASDDIDVEAFEAAALAKYNMDLPAVPPRYRSPYFAHIFAGGYSANYYAYMWSEVLAADAFAFMGTQGGLNRENGMRYRELILSRGGSLDAMEMYREFRGADPDVKHLLKRRGLDKEVEL
ncbi:MAG: dipeptidyl carboxypeptidase II [Bacteroidetes bacterium]|jgi:peptidyl-dipeptidase Dcp|nr:MAG: dipeptidyl carboxypeptidase II [Bacteroidota bacterium]PTM19785.1 MAG: dipeptidyl carboxypeptidase II [Bacteroidota bacterium]